MKREEIKNKLDDKSGYDKEESIIEKKIQYDTEMGIDVTAYGEFMSSYFAWLPLSRQKRRAEELNQMTKKKNNENKNTSNK